MADLIQIKGGSGTVPTLQDKELAYSRDEKALYIGTPDGNVLVAKESWGTDIESLKSKPDYYTKAEVDELIAGITVRLDALTPSE
jgi:hypothetical protein